MDKVLQAFALQASPGTLPAQIKEATTWLEHFQSTTEAWQVADQLLQQPADGSSQVITPVHIFAAQTMRAKIVYDWAELPAEAHASLRQSLLDSILRFGQGPQPVLTQLCLAVGVLALHMEDWHATVVNDLITALTQPADQAANKLPCLLELLQVLPEEAENYKVGVLPRRRSNFRQMLDNSSPSVFVLLGQVCDTFKTQAPTPSSLGILDKMLRCTASWMRHHPPPEEELASLPLLNFSFDALNNVDLFDAAAELCVDIIQHTTDLDKYEHVVPLVVGRVLQLMPHYETAVAAEEEDAARAFCRIFAEAGEQYLRALLSRPQEWALPIARAVLAGAKHPEPDVAEITFNFWYVLSEELAGGGQRMLPPESIEQTRAFFAPLFLEVVDALRVLVEFASDSDTWSADKQDDFKRFRYAVGDAIFDSCKVAGSSNVIKALCATLQQKLPAFSAQPQENWREVEGCVYCFRQSISQNDANFFAAPEVGQLLQLLPNLPPVGLLKATCIRTVGTYANWLSRNPQELIALLTFVSGGLNEDKTAAAAAQAMRHLCEGCAEHLATEATMQQLLQMYQGTLPLQLQPADRVDLISALAFVVSMMEMRHMLPAMEAIAQPLVARLSATLQSPESSNPKEVADCLEQLCALLRSVTPPSAGAAQDPQLAANGGHPCVQMLDKLWDTFAAVFARHGTSSNCMEKLCRCYKHTARNCGDWFRPLVHKLIPQVCQWFTQHPHSCFLYMCNVCLTSFGQNERVGDLLPTFTEAYQRMTQATFTLLNGDGSQLKLVDHPDVVDDFFELSGKVLRFQPQLLLESPLLTPTFQCGCEALHLQHREAGRSAFRFFDNLIDLLQRPKRLGVELSEGSMANLRAVLGQCGPKLVTQVITAIAGALPASRTRLIAPLLKELIKVEAAVTEQWARATIQGLPAEIQTDGGVFVGNIITREALVDDKVFIQTAEAFGEACRRKKVAIS